MVLREIERERERESLSVDVRCTLFLFICLCEKYLFLNEISFPQIFYFVVAFICAAQNTKTHTYTHPNAGATADSRCRDSRTYRFTE